MTLIINIICTLKDFLSKPYLVSVAAKTATAVRRPAALLTLSRQQE